MRNISISAVATGVVALLALVGLTSFAVPDCGEGSGEVPVADAGTGTDADADVSVDVDAGTDLGADGAVDGTGVLAPLVSEGTASTDELTDAGPDEGTGDADITELEE